jgi:pyruvate formate lyase activating enzyme
MREAMFYKRLPENKVKCELCPNYCIISEGDQGKCRSRENISGALIATNYGKTVSVNIDPIEKKPLYHYYPGSQILSLGANSCNLECSFCQNYEISQEDCPTRVLLPDELLSIMLKNHQKQVAFTYTEPFTWFEYILDCGKLFKDKGIRIVLVTNGYVNPEPLEMISQYIDAMNIDLKSMREEFYIKVCKGNLAPVLETIKTASKNCHVELTNLIIPGLNDGVQDIVDLADFVQSIDSEIPLHFSRYFPRWKCTQPITGEDILLTAYEIAKERLKYVYIGNVPTGEYSDTHCPQCRELIISRSNYIIDIHNLNGNKCHRCGYVIYGQY